MFLGSRAGACWVLVSMLFLDLVGGAAQADDWPQWLGPQRDGVWRETGILDKFPKDGLKVRWRSEIGAGFSGPAVVGDRVYVMDRQGAKLAKGAETPGKDGSAG